MLTALALSSFHPQIDPKTTPTENLIHAEPATETDWPMTGALLISTVVDGGERHTTVFCTGTLIRREAVLLAAHCVDPEAYRLQYGERAELTDTVLYWSREPDLSDFQVGAPPTNLPADAIEVASVASHPGYDLGSMTAGLSSNDDVALLFLATPLYDVPLAQLPSSGDDQVQEGEPVWVVGWGLQTAEGAPTPTTYGIKQMGLSEIAAVGNAEFQVGAEPSSVRKCNGDSGGPTFLEASPGDFRLVGVTSHAWDGTGCQEHGGVDTRLGVHLDWIASTLEANPRAQQPGTTPGEEPSDLPAGCATASRPMDADGLTWLFLTLLLISFTQRRESGVTASYGASCSVESVAG